MVLSFRLFLFSLLSLLITPDLSTAQSKSTLSGEEQQAMLQTFLNADELKSFRNKEAPYIVDNGMFEESVELKAGEKNIPFISRTELSDKSNGTFLEIHEYHYTSSDGKVVLKFRLMEGEKQGSMVLQKEKGNWTILNQTFVEQ